jgi:hypothetical protein
VTILFKARTSDSPYVDTVMRGWTVADGPAIRPAETHWYMVIVRHSGGVQALVVGPWSAAGVTSYLKDAELLWVRFPLGTFMPHLPVRRILNLETTLPNGAWRTFWLDGISWQYPDYDNVETFVDRLVREDVLVHDPVISSALDDRPQDISPRTLRDHFLRATGLSQNHIRQAIRAERAAGLLAQGVPILDVTYTLGYFDQPHLTRAMKRFVGMTPAQQLALASQST